MPEPLDGIVLAGGRSRRLGRDKATLTFGGRLLLEIVVERLGRVCREVVVACGEEGRQVCRRSTVRSVADAFPGQGPLAGIEAGFRAVQGEYALVVSCDLPFLNPRLLAYMGGLPRQYQALVPWFGGRLHPLHAIYSRSCHGAVRALLEAGHNSLADLLAELHVCMVPEEEVRRFDPEGLSMFNLNDADDLAKARALWRRMGRKSLEASSPAETAI